MKIIVKILISVLVLTSVLACFSGCTKEDVPSGYQLIAREGDPFRLFVPTQGWTPNTSGGVTSAFFSVANSEVNMPAASVSVYVADDADGCKMVEEYWLVCKAKLESELASFALVTPEPEITILGGEEALRCVYTAKKSMYVIIERDGKNVEVKKEIDYKFMQIMAMHDGEMYVLIFSAPAAEYENRVSVMDPSTEEETLGIIGNFRFDVPYVPEDKKVELAKADAPDGMKVASLKGRPYVFFCPTDWQIDSASEITAVKATDGSNVSVQYIMPGTSSVPSVSEYYEGCMDKYSAIMTDFVHDEPQAVAVGGVKNGMIGTFSGKSGGVTYKFKQAIALRGGVFYVVTYTATEENYDAHIEQFDKMLENFSIISNEKHDIFG